MRYLIKSLSDKITAMMIFLLLTEFAVGMFLAIDCLVDYHFYDEDCKIYAMHEMTRIKAEEDFETIQYFTGLSLHKDLSGEEKALVESFKQQYDLRRTNVAFAVKDESGAVVLTNMGNEQINAENSQFASVRPYSIADTDGTTTNVKIYIFIRNGLPAQDSYRLAARLIDFANYIKYPILVVLIMLVLGAITVLGMVMSSIGRGTNPDPEAKPERFIDKVPLDLMTAIVGGFVAFAAMLIILTSVAGIKQTNLVLWNAVILILALFIAATLLLFAVSISTRIKYGHMFRNTVIFRTIAWVRKKAGKENDGYFKVPFAGKILISIGLFAAVEVIVTLVYLFNYRTNRNGLISDFHFVYYAIFQIVIITIIGSLFYMMANSLYHLRMNSRKIASGDFDITDDSSVLFGEFREISNDFADIKDDMIKALEEKNKEQQVRSELIANISHDIKTPLTSIINYSDIVGSGDCSEEEMKNYLDIIGRQSEKLGTLLQSLIEVSKLSSGVVEADFESLDISLYLSQMIDELGYIFEEKNLKPDMRLPDESVFIECDGTMIFRVFENLIGNIGKYSMPGSRVYIKVKKADGRAVIELRNTSEQKITLTEEELLQRFRRNDRSRHTSGNGLGLPITKSFVELQRGTFDIQVDDDLFKTILTFELSDKNQ